MLVISWVWKPSLLEHYDTSAPLREPCPHHKDRPLTAPYAKPSPVLVDEGLGVPSERGCKESKPLCPQLLSMSQEEPWDLELHPEEKTSHSDPGLGPQDLLAASLTAVLLGGWILFLMWQVSPPPQPQVCLRAS